MKIAIHQNKRVFDHSITWDKEWIKYCEEHNLQYEIVDCFSYDIIKRLKEFDCLLWHFQNYVYPEMLFARSILDIASNMGLKVFPDLNTSWHYDDKVSQMYLLQSIDAPIPESWIFFEKDECVKWINDDIEYPIVAKLRCGAGSHNVKLIRSRSEALSYTEKMFNRGIKASPNVIFKAKSNFQSAKDWKTILSRVRRIPEFIQTLSRARRFGRERDYCYFQDFIPNDGFDLKVVVIGDKIGAFLRKTRKGDFRASGGGSIIHDKSIIPEEVLKSAFDASKKLGFQCMGYDFVLDKNNLQGKLIEMSYGFAHSVLLDSEGYWDRNLEWHDEPMDAPFEIIKNLINV